ncbi:MAG: hypothetical protein KZQ78_12250, partial [Candidatus Thiodiazotropha sp. (ex Ustalcina ferruginea)]|nr:hypothetical protein [Candidatus Thiodiazotropha sp. (ex Ustalcina ferruginea)]
MTESDDNSVATPMNDRLDITRGVMSMLDSWGLHSDEMMALLDMPGKARHFPQYRYNKPLPDTPDIMKRVEYLIR